MTPAKAPPSRGSVPNQVRDRSITGHSATLTRAERGKNPKRARIVDRRDKMSSGVSAAQALCSPKSSALRCGFGAIADHEGVAEHLVPSVGLTEWQAGILPHDKTEVIQETSLACLIHRGPIKIL